ncbi:uncharacterized protein VICG_01774 [Vittaforma corneae ATCC 50505]|uniref:Uncharacterized protein n=1 Tax=Vittaforma corneae (strain ATCC 50505) TaxID=993615 RepID=L2GL14_VITCO|nr:uncharacterized protein VICG_01774 [Vittaforma corneae ATCC 50505]ELA41175.1 hypothetical protein VICG_01774 [Vittaforma corneae ATCC 50505]
MYRLFLKSFINKCPSKTIKFVLASNTDFLVQSIQDSFDSDGTLQSKVYFNLWVSFLSLYDHCPSNKIQGYLRDFGQLESLLHGSIQKLLSELLILFGYKANVCVSKLYTLEVFLISFVNISIADKVSINENTELARESHSASKVIRRMLKTLHIVPGAVAYGGRSIKEHAQTHRCTNESCHGKILVISQNGISYVVCMNDKTISKKHTECLKCSTCGSKLEKIQTRVCYEYRYFISMINESIGNDCFMNRYLTMKSSIKLVEHPTGDKPFKFDVRVVGYLARDQFGRVYFHCLSLNELTGCSLRKLNFEHQLTSVRNSPDSSMKKLQAATSKILSHKKTVTLIDSIVVAIANIFNGCCFDDNAAYSSKEECTLMISSPASIKEFISPNDRRNAKEANSERRMLIQTNDVSYVISIFRSVCNITVFYSAKEFIKNYKRCAQCIYISEQIPRNIKKSILRDCADFEFNINIDSESLLDCSAYEYSQTKPVTMDKRWVGLDENEQALLKEVFTKQRSMFKGLIKPYKLLRTTEALYISLKQLTGDSESIFMILEHFNKCLV